MAARHSERAVAGEKARTGRVPTRSDPGAYYFLCSGLSGSLGPRRNRLRLRILPVFALLGGLACGSAGLKYRGQEGGAPVLAHEVVDVESLPDGYRELGAVRATCQPVSPQEGWSGVAMSDVHCTFEMLAAALEAKAASVGGTRLVASQCEETGEAPSGPGPARRRCSARVAAPETGAAVRSVGRTLPGRDPAAADLQGELLYASVLDAWRVELTHAPSVALGSGAPVPARNVLLLAEATPGQTPVGVLTARCEDGCARSSLRSGLLLGAARLGATSLVGMRCSAVAEQHLCQAEVALTPVLVAARRLNKPAGSE